MGFEAEAPGFGLRDGPDGAKPARPDSLTMPVRSAGFRGDRLALPRSRPVSVSLSFEVDDEG
jgi:hypothetical protein